MGHAAVGNWVEKSCTSKYRSISPEHLLYYTHSKNISTLIPGSCFFYRDMTTKTWNSCHAFQIEMHHLQHDSSEELKITEIKQEDNAKMAKQIDVFVRK